jgi:hypothetical protein
MTTTSTLEQERLVARPRWKRASAGVREYFFLDGAIARSSALPPAQRSTVRAYYAGALRRLRTAQELRFQHDAPAAILLYGQANLFLIFAFLASRDSVFDARALDADGALVRFETELKSARIEAPPSFAASSRFLSRRDPLELDRLPGADARRAIDDLENSAAWLARLVDPRSPLELKTKRAVRLVVSGAAALAVLVYGVVWAFSTPNVALRRPATSSSQSYDTTPDGAVDGRVYGQLGFHSANEDSPWLAIDLGRPYKISRVRVYGRAECCFDQSVPLALEASDDGVTYRKVDERTESFSQFDPWVAKPRGLVARFVRLRTMRHSFLVTSEVEVYGRPAR